MSGARLLPRERSQAGPLGSGQLLSPPGSAPLDRTLWRIVIPLSLPGLAVTSFYAFITAWNEVLFANVFLTETDDYTLPIGLRTYVFQFEQQYGWLAAGAVLVTIPALIMFMLAQRYLVSGLTRGGVKG